MEAQRLLEELDTLYNIDLMANDIKNIILKYFKRSYAHVKATHNLGDSIIITFALGKDGSEWANNIIHNDPAHTLIFVRGFNKDGSLLDKQQTEMSMGGLRLAGERIRIPYNKKTGTKDQVLKHIDQYFKKLRELVDEHKGHIFTPSHFGLKSTEWIKDV